MRKLSVARNCKTKELSLVRLDWSCVSFMDELRFFCVLSNATPCFFSPFPFSISHSNFFLFYIHMFESFRLFFLFFSIHDPGDHSFPYGSETKAPFFEVFFSFVLSASCPAYSIIFLIRWVDICLYRYLSLALKWWRNLYDRGKRFWMCVKWTRKMGVMILLHVASHFGLWTIQEKRKEVRVGLAREIHPIETMFILEHANNNRT